MAERIALRGITFRDRMQLTSIILIAVAVLMAIVLLRPRLLKASAWRATATPLASIIGSGFLIAGPVLAETTGRWAWLAMAGLCAVGYLFGEAVRYNIRHVEPELADGPPRSVRWIERASHAALSFAYFVSVAYYLALFASFALRTIDVHDELLIRIVTSVLIGGVGVTGLFGGLKALERVEVYAVGLKLSVIGGLIIALIAATVIAVNGGGFGWSHETHPTGFREVRMLLGLVVLVQGFETSRFLGEAYSADMRIRTMRRAQLLATGIYIAFILLITAYFTSDMPTGEATAIIDILAPLGIALAPMIILAALASQLSAAVADTNGAGGLLAETLGNRVSVKVGNAVTAGAALVIVWAANIFQIIAFASQAFALYYALISLQAAWSAFRNRRFAHTALFAASTVLAALVVAIAIPAEG